VKTSLLVGTVLLAVTGCSGHEDVGHLDAVAPAPAPTTSSTPSPQPLTVTRVATLPTESGAQGLALCGHDLAYVRGTSQIVLVDWKTGTSRTVFSTDDSFLYAVRQVGCRLEVHDTVDGYNGENPREPGRTLSVDLRTGRVTSSPTAPFAPVVVGRGGANRSVELVDGTTWRSLVLATPTHVELLSDTGQVAWASMSGRHVAWVDGVPDRVPDSVHVVDVADPGSPVVLAEGGRPSAVAVGSTFVVWTAGARQFLAPLGGGPVFPVPGPRSPQVWIAAHGDLLARVTRSGDVEVLRVGA
jgi:hypothetical protein